MHRAAERADNSGGERALESEGISDGEDALPDLQISRIAQLQRGELVPARIDLNEGDVVARVGADVFRFVMRLVAKNDLDRLRAMDHVVVRQDVPVGIDDESRARAFHRHRIEKEIVLHGARDDIRHGGRRLLVDADIFFFDRVEGFGRSGRLQRYHRSRRALAVVRAEPVRAEADDCAQREQA